MGDSDIASVVLGAGRGERLRPLTDHVPKAAVPMLDVPLAALGLARVAAVRSPVLLNLSHLPAIGRRLLEPWLAGAEVLVETPDPLGSGGTVAHLRDRIGDALLTHNCDALTDVDLSALLAVHGESSARATIAVQLVGSGADLEVAGGRAVRFIDRRAHPDAPGHRFIGVAVWERSALDLLSDERPLGLGESLLGPLIGEGEVAIYEPEAYAVDVGTPERYLRASLDLLHERLEPAVAAPGTRLEVAGGRAYVGPGAEVELDSLGAGAIVLEGARVDPGARIERAMVWPRETVPAGVRLSDAIWALGEALPAVPQKGEEWPRGRAKP